MARVPLYIDPYPREKDVATYRILSEEFGSDWSPDRHIGTVHYDAKARTCTFLPESYWSERNLFPASAWTGTEDEIIAARESDAANNPYSQRLLFWMRAICEKRAVRVEGGVADT